MPIKSKSQQRLMYSAANNSDVAKKTGVSKEVAQEFIDSSKNVKFKKLKERLKPKKG